MGKSRKKAWKRIPRTADEEIPEIHKQKELQNLPDDQLFEIDDEAKPFEKLTVKQKRLQAHRERLSKMDDSKEHKKPVRLIQKREKIHLPSKLERSKNERAPKIAPSGVKPNLLKDPWADEDDVAMNDNDEFVEAAKMHDLKTRKAVKVKEPKTRKYIPSALPAIKVADPGASYNPEVNEYLEYANKLANEEVIREKAEERLNRQIGKGMKYITPEEQKAELEQGFYEESTDEEDDDIKSNVKPELFGIKKQPKAKSDKLKKRQLRRKIAELERKSLKESTKREREQIANLKKLYKEIDQKIVESKEKAAERAANKVFNNLTKRKQLGRGEFKEYEEPVALPSEIKGSLRLAKTEGNLMNEHVKSLQARNILAIAGDKETRKLPKRLKRKFVDKWDIKKVTADSTRH
uniref:Ribosome biogenesis protein NOP53 n=1 Tax=Panagrolaimus sp. PS1159 TaxID=55785 RepID=A0AC35FFR1_9BILA